MCFKIFLPFVGERLMTLSPTATRWRERITAAHAIRVCCYGDDAAR